MKIEDFRVGNFIEYDYPDDTWAFLKIAPDDIKDLGDKAFRPIPLSEASLLSLGFIKNPDFDWERDYEWNEFRHPNGWACAAMNDEGYIFTGHGLSESNPLEWVHQVQNLIHAVSFGELSWSDVSAA